MDGVGFIRRVRTDKYQNSVPALVAVGKHGEFWFLGATPSASLLIQPQLAGAGSVADERGYRRWSGRASPLGRSF